MAVEVMQLNDVFTRRKADFSDNRTVATSMLSHINCSLKIGQVKVVNSTKSQEAVYIFNFHVFRNYETVDSNHKFDREEVKLIGTYPTKLSQYKLVTNYTGSKPHKTGRIA